MASFSIIIVSCRNDNDYTKLINEFFEELDRFVLYPRQSFSDDERSANDGIGVNENTSIFALTLELTDDGLKSAKERVD